MKTALEIPPRATHSRSLNLLRIFVLFVAAAWLASAVEPIAVRVIVLANRDDPGSLAVARHYAELRGVPRENIFALPMPQSETVTWTEFVTTIWNPLETALIERGWIDALPTNHVDEMGRPKLVVSGHRIAYLVVCRGVPLKIAHDEARYRPFPPLTENPIMRTNQAAVDSELSLLATSETPTAAFVDNPLFRQVRPSELALARVVKVSRLDGPTIDDALALVDRAMAAERVGLIGRGYVDLAQKDPTADGWLRNTAAAMRHLGFDVEVDDASATMSATARCDAPALYFGWYTSALDGPFALPGFRFPIGAVAIHIHSDSGATLRSTTAGWSGPLIARGVTATVGNVFEPYLQLLHRPDLLFEALAHGERFGDAAYYALPALSWEAIAIGDPLYQPFKTPLERQVAARANLSARDAGYVTVREMTRLEAANRTDEALGVGRAEMKIRPTLALGWAVAERDLKAGERAAAIADLVAGASQGKFEPDEWGLMHEAISRLRELGASREAERFEQELMHDPRLPATLRAAWSSK